MFDSDVKPPSSAPRRLPHCLAGLVLITALAPLSAQQPQPPDAATVIIEGQVLNEMGGGHTGAIITLSRQNPDGSTGEQLAQATADTMGDFSITAPRKLTGIVVLTITQPKYQPAVQAINLDEQQLPVFVGMTLEGALTMHGTVINAHTREPVAGATVQVHAVFRDWTTTTDEQGAFSISGLPPASGRLSVEADGLARESAEVAQIEGCSPVSVMLRPQRLLEVKVTDDQAQPVVGATVEVYDKAHDDFRTLVTDAAGLCVVKSLHFEAAELQLRVSCDGFVAPPGFVDRVSLPRQQLHSTHQSMLRRAGGIRGKVLQAGSDKPVHGARVIAGREYLESAPCAFSDLDGAYELAGVEPGEAVVTVHRADFAPQLATIQVQGGQTAQLNLQLMPPRVVRGRVLSEDNQPFPGVYLATGTWRGHQTLGLRVITDQQGEFVIHEAPADDFELIAFSPHGAKNPATVPVGDQPIQIIMPPAPTAPAERFKSGDAAPAFELTTLSNEPLRLADLKGRVVLLDFWATWCGGCVLEIPNLKAIYNEFGARKDFTMISVSLDFEEQDLRRFIEQKSLGWHHAFGEKRGAQKAAQDYGVEAIPALFLIDAQGRIVSTSLNGSDIRPAVAKALGITESK